MHTATATEKDNNMDLAAHLQQVVEQPLIAAFFRHMPLVFDGIARYLEFWAFKFFLIFFFIQRNAIKEAKRKMAEEMA